jgi:hypothetical protein
LLGIAFVALSLRRPAVDSYAPTPSAPRDAGPALVGPIRYTIDASSSDEWRFFDFSQGSTITPRTPLDWDLAFKRFHIIANGGAGFSGRGGIANLGEVVFESVREAPANGYVESTARADSANAATAHWYKYSFTSHLLKPKPDVWVVRTADGRYARMRILSYYCPGAQPGCITFEYVYQGSKIRRFED